MWAQKITLICSNCSFILLSSMQVLLKIIKSCEAHGNDIKNNKSNAICKNKLSWWVPSLLTLLFVEKHTKIVRQRNQTPFLDTIKFSLSSWKIMTINHIDTSPNFQCCFKIPGWNTTNGPF